MLNQKKKKIEVKKARIDNGPKSFRPSGKPTHLPTLLAMCPQEDQT